MVSGSGLIKAFKGLTKVEDIAGGRANFLTDDGYASLGDKNTPGFGVIFKCIDLLFFMGGGPLIVNGVPVLDGSGDPVLASSQFQYLVRDGGLFNNGDDTHRFDVGHAQPSAPNVYAKSPPSPSQKPMNAVVSIDIWRADSITGQPSRPSESVLLTLSNASAIVQFPNADANAQDVWGVGGTLQGVQIGNLYEIPTSRGGEVLESVLTYTRTVTATCTDTLTTLTLDAGTPAEDRFTSADQGRRVRMTGLDSWVVTIPDEFNAIVNDPATANTTGDLVFTQAVDGYERAIEISWSDDDLLAAATLAPFFAFEPMAGRFAGYILDTFFIEDVFGTIFISLPNELSFPREKRKLYTDDKATVYVDSGWGMMWRIAPQSVSQLYYVPGGGSFPIGLSIKSKNIGCKYPTNASLGYGGRLMMWGGSPMTMSLDGSLDATIHTLVASEFDDWIDQTADQPVVTAYDPVDKYELWCYGNKIMATHAPTGRWCSPIYIDNWVEEGATIVGQVIVNERLELVVKESTGLVHYQWNVGTGSDMLIKSFFKEMPGQATISEVEAVVRSGNRDVDMEYTLVGDFTRRGIVGTDTVKGSTNDGSQYQVSTAFRPDLRGITMLGVEILCTNADGYAAVDFVNCWGEWNEAYADPRSMS